MTAQPDSTPHSASQGSSHSASSDTSGGAQAKHRSRVRAAIVSLVVGTLLLGAKFGAYFLTDSVTVFSDAMESIVNVVAAAAALTAVIIASQPADDDHPYGHGKAEFLSAAFEGGLIVFAAIWIVYEAVVALVVGAEPHELGIGMGVVAGAGVANLLLGRYLVRTGRDADSAALVADGKHVISDFWTSAGAVIGLLIVHFTGLAWLDAVVAILVAANLSREGASVVRGAMAGLMDETDPELVADIAAAMEQVRVPGVIDVHELRAMQTGRAPHVDLHVIVPEFWTVQTAHDELDDFEQRTLAMLGKRGELAFHTDPCRQAYCRSCELPDCPIRQQPFEHRDAITTESVQRMVEDPHGSR